MKCLALILAIWFVPKTEPRTVVRASMKCISFHTHTAIPIHENSLERINTPNLIKQENSTRQPLITEIYQILKASTVHSNLTIDDDYDLRMILRFWFQDGSQETFFINADKKGLLHGSRFSLIGHREMTLIEKVFDCKFCNTGQR